MRTDLLNLKAFLEKEAQDHVKFVNEMQARRTAESKGYADALMLDYRGLVAVHSNRGPRYRGHRLTGRSMEASKTVELIDPRMPPPPGKPE